MIAWWRRALRCGKLNDLNRYRESGDNIIVAGASGPGFNIVALATPQTSTHIDAANIYNQCLPISLLYLTATLAVMILDILVVIPTFHGF